MLCTYCLAVNCLDTPLFTARKAARIASIQASITALGNGGKPERERLNVSEFLLNLGVPFLDADIVSVSAKDEPPDVLFDPARFEIKELYDEGRRRMDEYRQRLQEAQAATRCEELRPVSAYSPQATTLAEVLDLATTTGSGHSQRYDQRLIPTLDLLLYHNLVDVMGMFDERLPNTTVLASQGWRSVSVLFGRRSIVLCATPGAPPWLRAIAGTVTHRR